MRRSVFQRSLNPSSVQRNENEHVKHFCSTNTRLVVYNVHVQLDEFVYVMYVVFDRCQCFVKWTIPKKMVLLYVNIKGADHTIHPHSFFSAFVHEGMH